MVRLLSIGIECLSSVIFIIPAIIILQYALSKQRTFNQLTAILIFALYSMAVFSATGIPSVDTLKVNFSFNFIPLIDIVNSPAEYIKNTILNIILFMPMGFLLPAIWKEYRSVKATVFAGLALSFFIEVSQIFTFRLTDIDDLITNTFGTFTGYSIGKMFSFKLPFNLPENDKKNSAGQEPVIILITVFLIGFFLKSFVSSFLWDMVLSSPLWERIR